MKILLFGGTFDPIHLGHLKILKIADKKMRFNKIIIIPSRNSNLKNGSIKASDTQRIKMIKNLIPDKNKYVISEIELNDKKINYSYDTVKKIISCEGEKNSYYFLVGSDQYANLKKWDRYSDLNKIVTFIALKRDLADIKRIDKKHIIIDHRPLITSSSIIRRQHSKKMLGSKNYNLIWKEQIYIPHYVKRYMSEYRFQHTLRVVEAAKDFAFSNCFSNKDIFRCIEAAYLHDIAKEFDEKKIAFLLSKNERMSFPNIHCAHGLAGAREAHSVFGVNDKKILEAIKNHVIPKEKTNNVSAILFLADKLESSRTDKDIKNRKELYELAKSDYKTAYKIVVKLNGEKYEKH